MVDGSAAFQTASVKLVTIIAPPEMQERLSQDLLEFGASGYTVMRVGGHGQHGPRRHGILDTGNIRIEAIVSEQSAAKVLERVGRDYADRGVIAFAHEVEAVPRAHFVGDLG